MTDGVLEGLSATELPDSSHLVTHLDDLPFRHGRPLPMTITEGSGSTVLANCTCSCREHSLDREVFMATINGSQGDERRFDPNKMLQ